MHAILTVVGNSVRRFEHPPIVFGAGDLDGGVDSFFLVKEGTIAFGLRHLNGEYSFVG